MSAVLILAGAIAIFALAYFTYARYIEKILGLDNARVTPAHRLSDGVDYVPAPLPMVFGHHFASIAGAGPIVGPILAVYFGWLPALLWILTGAIFIGAVHDFASLSASIRHDGRSIGSIIEQYIGVAGKKLFLLFSFSALVLVIGVFMRIVVATFVKRPEVGTASLLFIALAVGFGFVINKLRVSLLPATIGGVIMMALCVWAGLELPLTLSGNAWMAFITVYIFIASIMPVSFLLQPRDYLNSYLLAAIMLMAILGIFLYQPEISMPAFTSFKTDIGMLFPILFVTVACGAVSGFHSLVAGGTTSKQLNKESDARPVGYGSMLVEGVLAVVALITAMYLTPSEFSSFISLEHTDPIAVFSNGIGTFSTALGLSKNMGITFSAMAISSFALTTLDTCVRLARFAFQEFFTSSAEELKGRIFINHPAIGSGIAVMLGLLLALSGGALFLWPLFGSANQLLGALALLAVAVWLKKTGKKRFFVIAPMLFMFAVSLYALGGVAYENIESGNWLITFLSILLLALGVTLAVIAKSSLNTGLQSK